MVMDEAPAVAPKSAALRAAIIAEARTWRGTPRGHQQRRKGVAVDCPGPLAETCKALGLSTFDLRDYGVRPNGELLAICRAQATEIPPAAMQPGDAVLMAWFGEPWHIALLVPYKYGGLAILHSSNTRGIEKVAEHRLTPEWRDRIVAAFRLPGVPAD